MNEFESNELYSRFDVPQQGHIEYLSGVSFYSF